MYCFNQTIESNLKKTELDVRGMLRQTNNPFIISITTCLLGYIFLFTLHNSPSWLLPCSSAVDCGAIPVLVAANPPSEIQVSTVYGSKPLRYTCEDGYWFSRYQTTAVVTCTGTRQWSVNGNIAKDSWPECIRELPYWWVVRLINISIIS